MAMLECKQIVPVKKRPVKAGAKTNIVTMKKFDDGTYGCSVCYEQNVSYDNRMHCSRCRMYEKQVYRNDPYRDAK